MKSLNYKIREYRFRILFFTLLSCSSFFSYGQSKPQKNDLFYSKIASLKPEMTKENVKKIMGEPYKISFTNNEKQEFIEDLYYKNSIYIEKWYVITYQCVFVNDRLKSLLQKELTFDSQNIQVVN